MTQKPCERCLPLVLQVPKFAMWLVALLLQPELANLGNYNNSFEILIKKTKIMMKKTTSI